MASLRGFDDDDNAAGTARSLLDEKAAARAQKIHWETYEQSRFITAGELQALTQFLAAKDSQHRSDVLQTRGAEAFHAMLTLLGKVSKDETLRALLTVLDDALLEDPSRVALLHTTAAAAAVAAHKPFLYLLESKKDPLVTILVSRILARVTTSSPTPVPDSDVQKLFIVLRDLIIHENMDSPLLALEPLMHLVRRQENRHLFVAVPNAVDTLRTLLRGDSSRIQLQYRALFVLWVLTFESDIAATLDKGGMHVIGEIVGLCKVTKKDKVARIAFAALRNMLENAPAEAAHKNATAMVSFKMLPLLALAQTKYSDEETQNDTQYLEKELKLVYEKMSSFEEYKSEVLSGQLSWSPVHRQDKFWRDNASRLNEDNYKLVKVLVELLHNSPDATVLAVAAHDIGEYVTHFPNGRALVERLRGKAAIMNHLQHESDAVKYEALVCLQKLMTQNWGTMAATSPVKK